MLIIFWRIGWSELLWRKCPVVDKTWFHGIREHHSTQLVVGAPPTTGKDQEYRILQLT